MSSVLDVSKPSSLRLFGFLFTAAGGLLIALGSLQTWATVGASGDRAGVLDTAIPGVDTVEGKVALAIGVMLLIGIVALRIADSSGARRAIAIAILVLSLGTLAVAAVRIMNADTRFADDGVGKIAASIAEQNGISLDQARELVGQQTQVDVGTGLWVVAAGGAIAFVGGLLDLAWVGQRRLQEVGADADSAG